MNDFALRTIPKEETQPLTDLVDRRRRQANARLDPQKKSAFGQFMTPQPVAHFMASLFNAQEIGEVRLLDAGAGVGSLTAAFVEEFLQRQTHISHIAATAYERDATLSTDLHTTLADCERVCNEADIDFSADVVLQDFI